jgi:hypothetical protein
VVEKSRKKAAAQFNEQQPFPPPGKFFSLDYSDAKKERRAINSNT